MSKQPKNTAEVKKNTESEVGINPIARLFGGKSLKRRVGRLNKKKFRGAV